MSITIIIIRYRKQELKLKGISQTLGRVEMLLDCRQMRRKKRGGKHWNPVGGTFLTLGSTTPCRERNDTETPDNSKRKLTERVPMSHCRLRDLEAGDKW